MKVIPMLEHLRKLIRDRRGNAIMIAGAALPIMVGFAGLATDTVQWVSWKRELQRAADSAAFAGAYAKNAGDSVDSAITTDLDHNNHNKVALLSGYPQTSYPTSADWTDGVKVELAVKKELTFSSLFLDNPPIVKVSGTAAMVNDGEFCLVALEKGTTSGITVGGSASLNMGCGAISNSRSGTESVGTNGNAYFFGANPVAGVGGLPDTIKGATDLQPYHIPMKDPFAGTATAKPPGTQCKTMAQNTYTTGGNGNNSQKHLKAGCYTNFSFGGQDNYQLDPGTYYLDSTSFSMTGNATVTGTGVTFVLTGSTPGSVSMNGNALLNVSAPTAGQFAKMLFVQAANAATDNANTINGNNGSKFDGALYFPNGKVNFTGSSSASTKCALVVAKKIDFSGNTDIQNNTTGCTANQKVSGKAIKLVA